MSKNVETVLWGVVLLMFALALASCSATNIIGRDDEGNIDIEETRAAYRKFKLDDIDAAYARAQRGNDASALQCLPELRRVVVQENQFFESGTRAGAIDTYEAIRLGVREIKGGVPESLHVACAAYFGDIRQFVRRMALIAGAGSVGAPVVGGLLGKLP